MLTSWSATIPTVMKDLFFPKRTLYRPLFPLTPIMSGEGSLLYQWARVSASLSWLYSFKAWSVEEYVTRTFLTVTGLVGGCSRGQSAFQVWRRHLAEYFMSVELRLLNIRERDGAMTASRHLISSRSQNICISAPTFEDTGGISAIERELYPIVAPPPTLTHE